MSGDMDELVALIKAADTDRNGYISACELREIIWTEEATDEEIGEKPAEEKRGIFQLSSRQPVQFEGVNQTKAILESCKSCLLSPLLPFLCKKLSVQWMF